MRVEEEMHSLCWTTSHHRVCFSFLAQHSEEDDPRPKVFLEAMPDALLRVIGIPALSRVSSQLHSSGCDSKNKQKILAKLAVL